MRTRMFRFGVVTLLGLGTWTLGLGDLASELKGTLLQSYDPGYYWMKSEDLIYRVSTLGVAGVWSYQEPALKREPGSATSLPRAEAVYGAAEGKILIRGTSIPSYFGTDHSIRVGNVVLGLNGLWLSSVDRSRMDASSGSIDLVVDRRAITTAYRVVEGKTAGPVRSPASVSGVFHRLGDHWTIRGVVMPGFDGRSYTVQVGSKFVRIDARELGLKEIRALSQTGSRIEVTIPSRAVEYAWNV